VISSLREAARYARENSDENTPRIELTVHIRDGAEMIPAGCSKS